MEVLGNIEVSIGDTGREMLLELLGLVEFVNYINSGNESKMIKEYIKENGTEKLTEIMQWENSQRRRYQNVVSKYNLNSKITPLYTDIVLEDFL